MQSTESKTLANFNIEDYIIQPRPRNRHIKEPSKPRFSRNYCTCRACSDPVFHDGYCFWHYQYEHYTSR